MAETEPVLNAASIPELLGDSITPPSPDSNSADASVVLQQPRITVYAFNPENGDLTIKDTEGSSGINIDQIITPPRKRSSNTPPSGTTVFFRFAQRSASIFARRLT